jgi:hypothetical protein
LAKKLEDERFCASKALDANTAGLDDEITFPAFGDSTLFCMPLTEDEPLVIRTAFEDEPLPEPLGDVTPLGMTAFGFPKLGDETPFGTKLPDEVSLVGKPRGETSWRACSGV